MKWRNIPILLVFVVLTLSLLSAQTVLVKQVPLRNISSADAHQMYAVYCASCHGEDGRGGAAAVALKRAPTDLSQLSRQNRGRYPSLHVQQSILACEHSQEMPQWRGLFLSLSAGNRMGEAETMARAVNLSRYVETLQR